MKRFRTIAFFATVAMLAGTSAYAGVLGKIGGFMTEQAWTIIATALVTGLGTFGLSYKLWGKVAKEGAEFAKAIYDAVHPNSPDGRKVNEKEMARIVKEAEDFFPSLMAAVASIKKK